MTQMKRTFEKIVFSPLLKRFMAGESLEEAIETVKKYNRREGAGVLVNFLGEDIKTLEEAKENMKVYLSILEAIKKDGLTARPSLKLSQFGLRINPDFCYECLKTIVEKARDSNVLVEIDMEDSTTTQRTIDLVLRLQQDGLGDSIRMAIQAYLRRSPVDILELSERRGILLRLCKGAYNEPGTIALKDEEKIKISLMSAFNILAISHFRPALATHDLEIINLVRRYYRDEKNKIEIQLLAGIRRRERRKLIGEGFNVWVYLPYGKPEQGIAYGKRRWKYFLCNAPSLIWDEILFLLGK